MDYQTIYYFPRKEEPPRNAKLLLGRKAEHCLLPGENLVPIDELKKMEILSPFVERLEKGVIKKSELITTQTPKKVADDLLDNKGNLVELDTLTVEAGKKEIEATDDPKILKRWLKKEEQGKDRSTLVSAIVTRIEEIAEED